MAEATKIRENRLRRVLERRGLRLAKSRRKDPGALGFGRYCIGDASGSIITGYDWDRQAHTMTLDDVEQYVQRRDAAPPEE